MCVAMISMSPEKPTTKGRIYPRPTAKCKVAQTEMTALIDSGASLSVISDKAYRRLWNNWNFTKLPMPNNLRVTGITGHSMKFVDYVLLDVEIMGRTIQRPLLVATGLDHTELVLGWDTIVEEHMIIDGETNTVEFKLRKVNQDKEWHAAALCAIRTEKIYPRTVSKMLLEPRAGNATLKEGTLGVCYSSKGAPLVIWDSLTGVDEEGRISIAVANFGHEPVAVRPDDCIAFMMNPEFHDMKIVEGEEAFMHAAFADTEKKDYPEPKKGCINELSSKEKDDFLSKLHCNAPTEWKQKYIDLIMRYNDVFSKNKFDLGWTDVMEHTVRMKDDNPVFVKQFRVPYEHQAVLHEFVDELLKKGAIRESRSPYNSPVFCVPKKLPPDAEPGANPPLRCVLDFRAVNRAAIPQSYSMKDCRECLDDIGRAGAKLYSQLDLTSGFWQQSLAKQSRPYTAFTVPGKMGAKFEWCVMPMGLQGSSSSFAMLIDYVLRGVAGISSYIDDVLAFSDTHDNHLKVLEDVFLRFRKYGLKLNMDKSVFVTTECQYLGFTLKQGSITTSRDKAAAIKNFPVPRTPRSAREFLGICNYFRGIIRNYHQKSEPLMNVLKPSSGWKGGELPEAARKSFENLQSILSSEPVLTLPRKDRQYILYTDGAQGDPTSGGGMGAMLVQEDEKGEEHAIGFASRALKKNEANYSAHLLEQATIVWAIYYFEHYLKGNRFIVRSDNKPSVELGTVHKKTLCRLQEAMLEFDFALEHTEGVNNRAADALSRNACVMALYAIDENEVSVEQAQRNCPTIGVLKRFLETGEVPEDANANKWVKKMAKTCHAEDGLVWHNEKRRGHREKPLLLVPEKMRNQLISEAHNRPEAGHGGVDRTAERVQMAFWWPAIRYDCQEFIKKCTICQTARTTKAAPAELIPLPITTRPGERVHMDLFGDLRSSSGGNKFIVVITDSFSKWTEVVPIPNKSAEEVGRAYFERWLCRYGASEALVTDCGREFCNQVVQEICKLWGCDKLRTTPWHPQTNSLAERYNKSIINYMKCALDNESTLDWETRLPMLQLSFNAHVHRATKETPFYMMFGRDPRLPYTNFRKNRWYGESYASAQMKALHEAHTRAVENMREAEVIRKEYYDRKAKQREFHIGDRILVHFPQTPKGINRKFFKHWKMCRVLARVGPVNLRVRTMKEEKGRKSEFLIHVDRCQHASQEEVEEFCDSVRVKTTEKSELKRNDLEKQESEIRRKRRLQFLKEIEEAEEQGFIVEITKKTWEQALEGDDTVQNGDHEEATRADHEESTRNEESERQEEELRVNGDEKIDRSAEMGEDERSRDVFERRVGSGNAEEDNPSLPEEENVEDSASLTANPEQPCQTPPKVWSPHYTTRNLKIRGRKKEQTERSPSLTSSPTSSAHKNPQEKRAPAKSAKGSTERSESATSIGGQTQTSTSWQKRRGKSPLATLSPSAAGQTRSRSPSASGQTRRLTRSGDRSPPKTCSRTSTSLRDGRGTGTAPKEISGSIPCPAKKAQSSSGAPSSTGSNTRRMTRAATRASASSHTQSNQTTREESSRNVLYLNRVPLERLRPEKAKQERQKILKAMEDERQES